VHRQIVTASLGDHLNVHELCAEQRAEAVMSSRPATVEVELVEEP
jgi:hypothetical protein